MFCVLNVKKSDSSVN